MTTVWDNNSPRAPLERSQLAREDDLLRHTTIFLTSTGTNATATLAKLPQENRFFLITAQHVARILAEKKERWAYQNPEGVVRYLIPRPWVRFPPPAPSLPFLVSRGSDDLVVRAERFKTDHCSKFVVLSEHNPKGDAAIQRLAYRSVSATA